MTYNATMPAEKSSIIREMQRFTGEFLFQREAGKKGYDLAQKTTLIRMARDVLPKISGQSLVEGLYDVAKHLWSTTNGTQSRSGSRENWRFTLVPYFDEELNARIETRVEKRISQIARAGKLLATHEWANQIPVASGLPEQMRR